MTVERLTIVLEPKEAAALRQSALRNLRRPRDEARYLLRITLGLTDSTQPTTDTRPSARQEVAGAACVN